MTYLFDLDGTLVDSNPCHESAWIAALTPDFPKIARNFDYELYKGRRTVDVLRDLGITDTAVAQRIAKVKQGLYSREIESGNVGLIPNARELLESLRARGSRLFLVTGGSRRSTTAILQRFALTEFFAGIITGDDVARSKPHPECYERCIADGVVSTANAIAIEDSLAGYESARAAGLEVILVNNAALSAMPEYAGDLAQIAGSMKDRGNMNRICAVIPAAGRGSRLGIEGPKILAPIDEDRTIWSVLCDLLLPYVDHIHVVVSPHAVSAFPPTPGISVSVQPEPLGMGDAIFGARDYWSGFDTVLIVWGDQVNLSQDTIRRTVENAKQSQCIVLPLACQEHPYVQYDLGGQTLMRVRQTREGDSTDPGGDSDVGVFALSVEGLCARWDEFLGIQPLGAGTGEINFLPFLPWLSQQCAWPVSIVRVEDPDEARGVNTPADLDFARLRITRTRGASPAA